MKKKYRSDSVRILTEKNMKLNVFVPMLRKKVVFISSEDA